MSLRQVLIGKSLRRTLIRGLALAAVVIIVARTLAVPVRAVGISMLPTHRDGQLLFFNALAYRFSDPARGDIVAVTLKGEEAVLIKRVVALPDERVRIVNGALIVNDRPVKENYVQNRAAWNVDEATLGPDEYYVIGDNRGMSARNHTFGIISRNRIFGRLLF